jgi:hypothetical protein
MNEDSIRKHEALPKSESVRLIAFEEAHVKIEEYVGGPEMHPSLYMVVVVTGIKLHPNIQVELKPLAYSSRPEYWGIEVVGLPRLHGQFAFRPQHLLSV